MSVNASLFGDQDFVQVRIALIREVGLVEAVVLSRIYFRARKEWREAYEQDGYWWWRGSSQTLAEDVGITEKQARRALSVLRTAGHLITEEHRVNGPYDRTASMRVNLEDGADRVAPEGGSESPSGATLPIHKEIREEDTYMSDAAEASSDADDEPSTEIVLDSDARRLCEVLSGMMSINGNRTPKKIPDAWVKAADRLLRIDGYTYDQAYMVLDWCQRSEFWQGNILSMPKFREKFDTLKGQMFRDKRAASAYKTREDRNAEILAKYRKEG